MNLTLDIPAIAVSAATDYSGLGNGIRVYNICTGPVTRPASAPDDTILGTGCKTLFNLNRATWVQVMFANSAPTGNPTLPTLDCSLETSFDGVNWTSTVALTQAVDIAARAYKGANRFSATPANMCRYYRLKFTANQGSGGPAVYATVTGSLIFGNK